MTQKTNYVCTLDGSQAKQFRCLLEQQIGWMFDEIPYSLWRAKKDKTTIVAYNSGKCVVQGKETPDVVQFILEPNVLKEARFGYEHVLAEEENPDMFQPHAGIDESGKGDYFGPLVISAAYTDAAAARELLQLGVTDSKSIKSDRKIADLAREIRSILHNRWSIVSIGPEAYNRMYDKIGNVNRLLAWGHARALEDLLEKAPECPRAISDQFGRKETVIRALMEKGKKIILEQMPKAEADIAVAAASILARDRFVKSLEKLSEQSGETLPKGAGGGVDAIARKLAAGGGIEALRSFAKLHFKTTDKALG